MVQQACQHIILRRDTHIDSLLSRLEEPRVRRIAEPMITGEEGSCNSLDDDYLYVKDIGLIRDDRGTEEPANPIYAEVMLRTLSLKIQDVRLPVPPFRPVSRFYRIPSATSAMRVKERSLSSAVVICCETKVSDTVRTHAAFFPSKTAL